MRIDSMNMKMANRMPVLFIVYGSPMKTIEDNEFNRDWTTAGKDLPFPWYLVRANAIVPKGGYTGCLIDGGYE